MSQIGFRSASAFTPDYSSLHDHYPAPTHAQRNQLSNDSEAERRDTRRLNLSEFPAHTTQGLSIALSRRNETLKLADLLTSAPRETPQQLIDYLKTTTLSVYPLTDNAAGDASAIQHTVSLKDYINHNKWTVPKTPGELEAMIEALRTPAPITPEKGDFSGALGWPNPLTRQERLEIYQGVLAGITNPGSGGLLGELSDNRPWQSHELGNLREAIQDILDSPKAQALGRELQASVGAVPTSTSATDYLLAAIHEVFDPQGEASGSRGNVAGFELIHPDNSGLTASAIVKRLANHLKAAPVRTGHERVNHQTALIAAHLLLSSRAPEFLVKDIPVNVTYGSQAWLTLSTAVGRIEAQAPGATATMKYADILRQGDVAALTLQQLRAEQKAKLTALMDWGVANRLIPLSPSDDYTANQQKDVLAAFQKQMAELVAALEVQGAPIPMRESMAADQLYDALGFNQSENLPYLKSIISKLGIPRAGNEKLREAQGENADFNELINTRFITLKYPNKDFPGPYSLLDLYISNRLFDAPEPGSRSGALDNTKNQWHLFSNKVKFFELLGTSAGFPDTKKLYTDKIQSHIEDLKLGTKTTVKYLISRLPADDLKFLVQGKVEFYREELIYDSTPGRNHVERGQPISNKPLVARCQIGSEVRFYEINPQKANIYRRADLEKNFKVGAPDGLRKQVLPGSDTDELSVPSYARIPGSHRYTTKVAEMNPSDLPQEPAYDSRRTNNLANFVTEHVYTGLTEKIKAYSKGSTTLETEVPDYVKYREFLLNLIPLRSAIVNFSKGNFAEGLGELALDALGFVTLGAATVGKALGAVAKGAKALRVASIIGKAAVSLLNPLDGVTSLITGVGRGLKKVGNVGLKHLNKIRGAAGDYDLVAAAKRFDASALGTYKREGHVVHSGTAVLTGGKWHAYDAVLQQPYGSALVDFVPSMKSAAAFGDWDVGRKVLKPDQKTIVDKWTAALNKHKFGPDKAQFEAAYHATEVPKASSLFSREMKPLELMALAQKKDLTASMMGSLVKQYDNLAFKHGAKGATRFIDNIEPEFGTVFAMPQASYLSSTAQFSDGQCAALSRTFATAIEQGKDKVLINNMYKASARPDAPASREFMHSLKSLQAQTGGETAFHAHKVPRQVTHDQLVEELAQSPGTKSVMIDTPGHAMAAGVIVKGSAKKYYFYDPNAGVAYFNTPEAMEKGLTRLFNDKTFPTPYRSHGVDPKRLEFKIFTHDDEWRELNSINQSAFKKLYEVPLDERAFATLSHDRLKAGWEHQYKTPGNHGLICYEASVRVGQAEKTLAPEVFDAVQAARKGQRGTNYSQRYLNIMGIQPDSLKTGFNPADIQESGLLNFKRAHEGGEFGHTVYIQKDVNNKLYLFNTNSHDLDAAMARHGNPSKLSGSMTVYHLGDGKHKGLQDFLDGLNGQSGWQFAYTPASTLNANVANLAV